MTFTRTTAFVLLSWLLAATAAAREDPDDVNALVSRGLELRRAGRSEEALALFRRAYEEAPSPRTLGQMGLVETSLQRWLAADAHLTATLATPADTWVHRNRAFIEEAAKRTRQHVGDLLVTGPPGTRIALGPTPVGTLPLEGPVRQPEGTLTLTATAAGYKPFSAEISIKGNAQVAITIALEPIDLRAPEVTAESPASTKPAADHTKLRLWTGVGLAVAGAGALALGIGWLSVDGRPDCDGCITVYSTRVQGYVMAGTGILALAAGGALLFLTPHGSATGLTVGMTHRSVELRGTF
ncbi:MAG TPA: hypothetical protein VHG72_06815 [Polyangia bacterium]|nr:hypothetical protein [Polyangia bacterium]